MDRTPYVAATAVLALLAACAQVDDGTIGGANADADRDGALTECRTRAAVTVSPAAGRGMSGYNDYNRAVAQCLRTLRQTP